MFTFLGFCLGLMLFINLGLDLFQILFDNPILAGLFIGISSPIFIISILWYSRNQRIKKANFFSRNSLYYNYDPYQFEDVVAEIFRHFGFSATVTRRSGDRGIDIILSDASAKYAVQCKQYNKSVGAGAIRDFVGSLAIQNFSMGYFVTTSTFTQPAIQEANEAPYKIKLVDGNQLSIWHTKAKNLVNTDLLTAKWWGEFNNKQKWIVGLLAFTVISLFSGFITYAILNLFI